MNGLNSFLKGLLMNGLSFDKTEEKASFKDILATVNAIGPKLAEELSGKDAAVIVAAQAMMTLHVTLQMMGMTPQNVAPLLGNPEFVMPCLLEMVNATNDIAERHIKAHLQRTN